MSASGRPKRRDPVIRAKGLRVGYGETAVCAPVDLDARPGDSIAIIGANGSGKSTLLRTLLGALPPISGKLAAFGRTVDERERDFRARVAGVLDDDAYLPGLTVREHIILTARGHAVPKAGAVADELLERFGIEAQADALPSTLSSGQRRRLLLASGFARPRDILLLDEPEQRLDPGMRNELAILLKEESAAGTAVLFATHDVDLVRETGARALLVADDQCRMLSQAIAVETIADLR